MYIAKTYLSDVNSVTSALIAIQKKLNNENFNKVATLIKNRLDYNAGVYCRTFGCYDINFVKDVIAIYWQMAKNNEVAEYDRKNKPSEISNIENKVYSIVKSNAKFNDLNKVKSILYDLYFATLDNSIKDKSILFPITNGNSGTGGNSGGDVVDEWQYDDYEAKSKRNIMLLSGVAIGLVAVIYFATKKKRRK